MARQGGFCMAIVGTLADGWLAQRRRRCCSTCVHWVAPDGGKLARQCELEMPDFPHGDTCPVWRVAITEAAHDN